MTATGSRNGRETGVCIFMEVILANPCGFCYGVQRAVRIAEEAADHLPAATLGPLIHNPQVTVSLLLSTKRLSKKIYKFWTQLARMSK